MKKWFFLIGSNTFKETYCQKTQKAVLLKRLKGLEHFSYRHTEVFTDSQ